MTIDWLLSALHFLLTFSLVALLAAQNVLFNAGMTPSGLRLAASLDRGYGASAILLLGVGLGRVFYGAKGASFYLSNPLFWTKMGLFAMVAVLSIPPTVWLFRWTKQAHAPQGVLPSAEQVGRIRRWLVAEAGVLGLMPFIAAAMARGW